MTLSLAVIDELSRALGADVPEVLRAALGRIEAAERGDGAASRGDGAVTVVMSRAPSRAALRTRAWRARKRAAALALAEGVGGAAGRGPEHVSDVTPSVTAASPSVTQSVTQASPVTVGDGAGDAGRQKEKSPRPPIRKTPLPQKGVSRRQRRHAVTPRDGSEEKARSMVFLDEHDARFRELVRMRGRSYPVHSGGWWFDPALVAEAEARISATVRPLRPVNASSLAIAAATGPPLPLRVGGASGRLSKG